MLKRCARLAGSSALGHAGVWRRRHEPAQCPDRDARQRQTDPTAGAWHRSASLIASAIGPPRDSIHPPSASRPPAAWSRSWSSLEMRTTIQWQSACGRCGGVEDQRSPAAAPRQSGLAPQALKQQLQLLSARTSAMEAAASRLVRLAMEEAIARIRLDDPLRACGSADQQRGHASSPIGATTSWRHSLRLL